MHRPDSIRRRRLCVRHRSRLGVSLPLRDAEMKFGESVMPFGDAALVRLGGIEVILNSTPAQGFDPSL